MTEKKLFKDWFDSKAVKAIGLQLEGADPSFDTAAFRKQANRGLTKLEMIDRVRQIAAAMQAFLPASMPKALKVLTKSLPPKLEGADEIMESYLLWPYGQFIADYAVDHFDAAMPAMYELTQRFSSEFAVRPFVEHHQDKTLQQLLQWTDDDNVHVRRWCSEGVRPRLPWGKRLDALVEDPSPIFPILEALRDDPELYVRRSVANNLNDIAKDHPDRVIKLARRWMKGASEDRAWLVRHALRSLVKAGNKDALSILGFDGSDGLKVELRLGPKKIDLGSSVKLQLSLRNTNKKSVKAAVDFRVHYVKSNGQARPKVFKWTVKDLAPAEELQLEKKLKLQHVSTRTLFAGKHRVDVQVNGDVVTEAAFTLRLP